MIRGPCIAAALAVALLAGAADAATSADLHEIKWFVHTDLLDPGAGRDLAFYQALLDAALADSRVLLEGHQGPVDRVCCSRLVNEEHAPGVTLAAFGDPGDGLDVLDTGELDAIVSTGGGGSRGYLIDSIADCNGSGPAVGCATFAFCGGPPDDDPDRFMVVTLDAADIGLLGMVIAHERGHNACLSHVSNDPCELMQSSAGGGCLSAAECAILADARTTTGDACACHVDGAPGADTAPEEDGLVCADGGGAGVCSGGVCGPDWSDAGVGLLAAGGTESSSGGATDDALQLSGLPGGWNELGALGATIRGLTYDPDAGILYGIEDGGGGDDSLVVIEPTTGAVTATIGSVTGHPDLTSLAFDPGTTDASDDDRLLALSSDGSFEDLIAIDPATATATVLGPLEWGVSGGFQGLAFDSQNRKLYASGFSIDGLWEIDPESCGAPFFCHTTEVAGIGITRQDPSLAYSRKTGRLYQVGRQSGSRILYDAIDATTLAPRATVGIDGYSTGGLAALPMPEPATGFALPAGVALLAALARRRERPGSPTGASARSRSRG
jgi:hypothetical protein